MNLTVSRVLHQLRLLSASGYGTTVCTGVANRPFSIVLHRFAAHRSLSNDQSEARMQAWRYMSAVPMMCGKNPLVCQAVSVYLCTQAPRDISATGGTRETAALPPSISATPVPHPSPDATASASATADSYVPTHTAPAPAPAPAPASAAVSAATAPTPSNYGQWEHADIANVPSTYEGTFVVQYWWHSACPSPPTSLQASCASRVSHPRCPRGRSSTNHRRTRNYRRLV
jgi:hypothetical protein